MSWFRQLAESARRARESFPPDARDAAGDRGEAAALAAIELMAENAMASLYPALRVPKTDRDGKHEIDLVLASPLGLLAIEVKHWGGAIDIQRDGRWRQAGPEEKVHEDHLRLLRDKVAALAAYLGKQGAPVAANAIHPVVLFTNPSARLTGRLAELPEVKQLAALPAFAQPLLPPRPRGVLAWLRSWFRAGESEGLLGTPFPQVRAALDRLPTWDLIRLRGGRILKGDLRGFSVKVIQGKNLRRSTVHDLDIRASGSWIGAFLRGTRLSWRGAEGSGRGRAAPSQQLTIKLAGQSREETVWLEHVEHVSLGWQDETYYDDPKPPLASYRVGTTYEGKVTGVTDFGVFVDFDGHRDGLVHMRRLEQRGRRLSSFQPGQRLVVKLVGTRVRDNGKEEVELDLAEE